MLRVSSSDAPLLARSEPSEPTGCRLSRRLLLCAPAERCKGLRPILAVGADRDFHRPGGVIRRVEQPVQAVLAGEDFVDGFVGAGSEAVAEAGAAVYRDHF